MLQTISVKRCMTVNDVFLLLKSSDKINHDLTCPFEHCIGIILIAKSLLFIKLESLKFNAKCQKYYFINYNLTKMHRKMTLVKLIIPFRFKHLHGSSPCPNFVVLSGTKNLQELLTQKIYRNLCTRICRGATSPL